MTQWLSFILLICNTMIFASTAHLSPDLFKVYENHRFTFFCDQPFSEQGKVKITQANSLSIETKIQWIPLVSRHRLAQHLSCYQYKICINKKGHPFKGLKCCEKINEHYQRMNKDLFNYVPEIALFKLPHYSYTWTATNRVNKTCQLSINKKSKTVKISAALRGAIARTYLYMRAQYNLPLSLEETALYMAWDKKYPADEWERERNQKIQILQQTKH